MSCPSSNSCPIHDKNGNKSNFNDYNEAINDFNYGDNVNEQQTSILSRKRTVSSIPKSDFTPTHQPGGQEKWIYPSEQQYYNAIKRKGYNPRETDIPITLAIHNSVNEEGWSKIKEWESFHGNSFPKLIRFMGKPRPLSPKAFILSKLGYSEPFDRHDWWIDRNGKHIRYVIDFYNGSTNKNNNAPIAMYLDVRPAIDNFSTIIDLLSFQFRKRYYKSSLPRSSYK